MRRPGKPRQRRRLHHSVADGRRRQDQGRSGPATRAGRRRCDRGGQQRSGCVRHRFRGTQEQHPRDPVADSD
nr:hypothetical protein [Mycobacterium sp. 852013-50091_SCH5140682]